MTAAEWLARAHAASADPHAAWDSVILLPAAVAALEAVLAMHKPVWHPDDADGYHCDECGADLTDETPDCPTVAAIAAHLDPS